MSSLLKLPEAVPEGVESLSVSRQAMLASRYLGELKGAVKTIPNETILIDTLGLQEAKDSSAIENIITTQDDLFQSDFLTSSFSGAATKEVYHYAHALRIGWTCLREQKILRLRDILAIQAVVIGNESGLRKQPGTKLKNEQTGQVIYEPPQDPAEVEALMANFLDYFNRTDLIFPDPLVRMAILHYQFESIHPFYDGNGRTGRILNLLYLVLHGLLDLPVLYLSRFIVRNKTEYYRGFQAVREQGSWEAWILYFLRGVEQTSRETLGKVEKIQHLMQSIKQRMRSELPNIYSQDLLNNLFRHPYTKIEFVQRDLGKARPTATKYLELLTSAGLLRKIRSGKSYYFINDPLVEILAA
jgi:Fic family protein